MLKFQKHNMRKGGGGVSLGAEGSFIYIMVSSIFNYKATLLLGNVGMSVIQSEYCNINFEYYLY